MNAEAPPSVAQAQPQTLIREFAMHFTSTPRGARLARRLVSHRLDEWGYPYDADTNTTVTLITAELTANAVRHGHVPGRDFHVRLTETREAIRIEVSDTRTERQPPPAVLAPDCESEGGRGLYLVTQLATHWAVSARVPGPGKTVWASIAPGGRTPGGRT